MKGPTGKTLGGIYSNPLFIHSAASLVGCIVHVQVKNGTVYEGVFRTFSQKVDFVLEMAHKVELKKSSNNINAVLPTVVDPEEITDKLIFKIEDVVMLTALNIDPEFASHENFTDASISKFNGQVLEKELEPWDGGPSAGDNVPELGTEGEANGWDPNDMFRTNEEKYGVKTCFDSTLQGYTIPLNKQDTEEYKQQEAKASKIAQEIESGFHYKNRLALENGDEEERFSAVLRPDNNNCNRFVTHRGRKPQGVRPVRSSPSPSNYQGNRVSHPHSQSYHKIASPATVNSSSQSGGKTNNFTPPTNCIPAPTQRPASSNQTPHHVTQPTHQLNVHQPPAQFQQAHISSSVQNANLPHSGSPLNSEDQKVNGEPVNSQQKPDLDVPMISKEQNASSEGSTRLETPHKNIEQHKDVEKKTLRQKAHENKTEDLKRFHEKFKLSESKETKESREDHQKSEVPSSQRSDFNSNSKPVNTEKSKEVEKETEPADITNMPDTSKCSTLNPNAKEFIFNPNAKTFTPRTLSLPNTVLPPPVQPPPRLHTQSPVMAVPQHHMMPGVPQPLFANVASHYVVTTPVSMAPPYTPATSMAQAPRFRKAMPITLQRHDMSQSIHVQAATGQPILAPPSLSTPQFTMYAPSPGMLHHPQGPPQPQLTYTQMYSLMGPRVLAPQPLGMVSTSGSYGENPHVPTHLYMTHPGTSSIQHGVPPGSGGQHSQPSTPQPQTTNLHPAPSPVHQPPPSTPHGQPPTPTGHNSNPPTPQVVYHSHLASQHPMHGNPASANQNHPYPGTYSGTPQPIMLLPQQPGPHALHPATFSATLQNHHLHGQNHGSHAGTPTHVMPHAMMPASAAAMVHSQTQMSSGNYVPHSQA